MLENEILFYSSSSSYFGHRCERWFTRIFKILNKNLNRLSDDSIPENKEEEKTNEFFLN